MKTKLNSKRQAPKNKQSDFVPCEIKMSLWEADEDKKYVLSGVISFGEEFEMPESGKVRVFIYENDRKTSDNSPDYYASAVEG